MMGQVRADLEQVLTLLEEGWCKYTNKTSQILRYGDGSGCLAEKMADVARSGQQRGGAQRGHRYDDMAEAIGFSRTNSDRSYLIEFGTDLTYWNDYVATWDMVKERVKDAIGKL